LGIKQRGIFASFSWRYQLDKIRCKKKILPQNKQEKDNKKNPTAKLNSKNSKGKKYNSQGFDSLFVSLPQLVIFVGKFAMGVN